VLSLPILLMLPGASGCTALMLSPGKLVSADRSPEQASAEPEGPFYTVDIQPENKPAKSYQFPLTEEGVYVNDVLQKSGAVKRFGRVKLELWRPSPAGAVGYIKLDIPYDRKSRAVPNAYNYALYAGDRLLLIEDSSTVLDDILESALEPLGSLRR